MPNPYVNKVAQSNGATLIDISDTTAVAADVASGKYFYLASGQKVVGTSSGSPTQTQHTILFEFEDSTTASITAYYDSTFISDAITATTPIEYGGKTVNSASLDGVEWYSAEAYVVLYEGTPEFYTDDGNYFWIPAMASVQPTVGSVWRITIDGTEYDCTAQLYGHQSIDIIVGNPVHLGGTDDGSGVPVACYNYRNNAWVLQTTTFTAGGHTVKIERQGTA